MSSKGKKFTGVIPGLTHRLFAESCRIIVFYNDGEENLAYFADQHGFVLTPEEAQTVSALVRRYYEKHGKHVETVTNSKVIPQTHLAEVLEKIGEIELRKRTKSAVYTILSSDGYYKIGYVRRAETVTKRISTLQTGSPHDLTLFCVFETDEGLALEERLHSQFEAKRVRGEWFELGEDDIDYLLSLDVDGSEPGTVAQNTEIDFNVL